MLGLAPRADSAVWVPCGANEAPGPIGVYLAGDNTLAVGLDRAQGVPWLLRANQLHGDAHAAGGLRQSHAGG